MKRHKGINSIHDKEMSANTSLSVLRHVNTPGHRNGPDNVHNLPMGDLCTSKASSNLYVSRILAIFEHFARNS
jgi:hypothetical protein